MEAKSFAGRGLGGPVPRLNERQLNGLLSRVDKDEIAKLFLEFVRYPNFVNEFHVGNLWHKLGTQLAAVTH